MNKGHGQIEIRTSRPAKCSMPVPPVQAWHKYIGWNENSNGGDGVGNGEPVTKPHTKSNLGLPVSSVKEPVPGNSWRSAARIGEARLAPITLNLPWMQVSAGCDPQRGC